MVIPADVSSQLVKLDVEKKDLEARLEEIKKAEEQIKEKFLEQFEATGLVKLENDDVMITYVAPSETETIDLKTLSAKEPELNNRLLKDYPKISKRKAYVRITCKKK